MFARCMAAANDMGMKGRRHLENRRARYSNMSNDAMSSVLEPLAKLSVTDVVMARHPTQCQLQASQNLFQKLKSMMLPETLPRSQKRRIAEMKTQIGRGIRSSDRVMGKDMAHKTAERIKKHPLIWTPPMGKHFNKMEISFRRLLFLNMPHLTHKCTTIIVADRSVAPTSIARHKTPNRTFNTTQNLPDFELVFL